MIRIDFRKLLELDHKISGFIARILSPKGRITKKGDHKSYSFHRDSVLEETARKDGVEEGLYMVIDIHNYSGFLQWNIYLVTVVEGNSRLVAEYLDSPDTLWVKEAQPLVKRYFGGEYLEEVELTKIKKKSTRTQSRWSINSKTKVDIKKPEKKQVESKKPKQTQKAPKQTKEVGKPLEYGQARLMTFTGMETAICKITRFSKKIIEVETKKGLMKFSREDGKQLDAKNPKYANKIEWNLEKENK